MPTEFEMEFFLKKNKKRVIFFENGYYRPISSFLKKINLMVVMEIFGLGHLVIIFLITGINHLKVILENTIKNLCAINLC